MTATLPRLDPSDFTRDDRTVLADCIEHLHRTGEIRAGLPASVRDFVENVLRFAVAGEAVTALPDDREVTTTQAADILHISRPFVTRLVDEGRIPCRMVGTHRRIAVADLVTYIEEREGNNARLRSALEKRTSHHDEAVVTELGLDSETAARLGL